MTDVTYHDLEGRRILFIGIGFYDYERSIAQRIRERGAEIVVFQEQPEELRSGFFHHLQMHRAGAIRRHENAILAEARSRHFDQVLIIKGVDLRVSFLKSLREALHDSEFILYQWDSLARLEGIEQRLPFFNRVLTFDRQDSQSNPEMTFRPLFFRECTTVGDESIQDLDITFVGWLHSDRLEGIRRMQAEAKALGLKTFIYIYTGRWTWLKLFLRGDANNVHPRTLSYSELMAVVNRSKCIYDLPHALQAGLTMRAIETLGLKKKLLTSALDVVHYDFYSADNVRVVLPPDTGVDPKFVNSPPTPVDPVVLRRYSLDAWLDDVLRSRDFR
jgi:hypothetical protein